MVKQRETCFSGLGQEMKCDEFWCEWMEMNHWTWMWIPASVRFVWFAAVSERQSFIDLHVTYREKRQ